MVSVAIFTAMGLAGCVSSPDEIELPLEVPEDFSESGTAAVPDRWWTAFEDAELNELVSLALGENFDLAAAWQRLRQARAIVERAEASLWPSLGASGEAAIQRPEDSQGGGEELRLGLSAAYEVDLWGRIRATAQVERFIAETTYWDYQTAALTLSAEVARTWYQLVAARDQLALLEEQVETNQQVLELIEARLGVGEIRAVDLLRQRQLVESTRELVIEAQARIQVLEHLLAVLLGRPPQAGVDAEQEELPEPPPLPETGLPMALVQRRPDVRSAYYLLLAADRDLAAAIADQYPSLNLSVSLFTVGERASDLFDEWIRSFSASLFAPVFQAGALEAEVDRAEALKRQRLYEYGQSTLVAFQEVENALIQERSQRERIESLQKQIRLSDQTYEQLRVEYFNGIGDYIDVLSALIEDQQLRRDALTARLQLLEFRIALYRALAGGIGEQVVRR